MDATTVVQGGQHRHLFMRQGTPCMRSGGAVRGRVALLPAATALERPRKERFIGFDHARQDSRVVIGGGCQEAMPPTPDCDMVHADPGRENLPYRAMFGHVPEILTPFFRLAGARHRRSGQDVIRAMTHKIAAQEPLTSVLVLAMQCRSAGSAMRTDAGVDGKVGSPRQPQFGDLFGYDGLNEHFQLKHLTSGCLGDLRLDVLKLLIFHAESLAGAFLTSSHLLRITSDPQLSRTPPKRLGPLKIDR
jgi:hypothetical protein